MKEDFNDPKIQAKLHLYFELIERGNPADLVDLDVHLPECHVDDYCYADIVIFKDLDHTGVDLVVECLPAGASGHEIEQAKEVAVIKGLALKSREIAYSVGTEVYRF